MRYQKIINFVDHTPSQSSKYKNSRQKTCLKQLKMQVERLTSIKTEIKITMLKSSLCHHSDAQILVKETIRITRGLTYINATIKRADKRNKEAVFKKCGFTNCIKKLIMLKKIMQKIQMPMHNLLEY